MLESIEQRTLNDVGSWASIVGLLVTSITFLMLSVIKKKFLFRSSIDEHQKNITHISSEISSLLHSFQENRKEIEEQFALADVELRAMQRGSSGDLLKDIKKPRRMIRKYTSNLFFWIERNEDSARKVKTTLSVVSAELPYHRKSLIAGN